MTVQEIEKKIALIEEEILECNRIISLHQNITEENLTEDAKFCFELIAGSMEEMRKISTAVIDMEKGILKKLEQKLENLERMRQEEKCNE